MTRETAKEILLLYRPWMADESDIEITAALEVVKQDAELMRWWKEHCKRQEKLRHAIHQIRAPAGLKEQIISERVVREKFFPVRRAVALAVAAVIVMAVGLSLFWRPRPATDDAYANYRVRMASAALRGYSMDFESGDLTQIRNYLARQKAPSDYVLPNGLQKISATGCAIENWQGAKVTMICFHTGQPLPPGEKNDLWLFVVDRDMVKNAPMEQSPQFSKVNKLITATWTVGDKLYLMGTTGDEETIRRYL